MKHLHWKVAKKINNIIVCYIRSILFGIMSQGLIRATFEKERTTPVIATCRKSWSIFVPILIKSHNGEKTNKQTKLCLLCLFGSEVFWLFIHIPSSFCLWYWKGKSLFALLLQDVFLNLKPCVAFKKMDKRGFSFTLLALLQKLLLTDGHLVLCLPISHRSISLKPNTDVSAEIFEKEKEKASWCLWLPCSKRSFFVLFLFFVLF